MKKHDESKDLQLLKRKCTIDYGRKLISASKSAILGNGSWGRIDFLTHYCGWRFIRDNNVIVTKDSYDNKSEKKKELRKTKKENKEHRLTNKNSKKSIKK